MRNLKALCLSSAAGAVVFYFLWVIAAGDDYNGGFKHVVAVTTAVLDVLCLALLLASAGVVVARRARGRR